MKFNPKNSTKYLSPFLWAVKLGYKASPRLFIATSTVTALTSSFSGVINAYLVAQTTASVALLAGGRVSLRTPIIWAASFALVSIGFDIVRRITSYYESVYGNVLDVYIYSMYATKVSSFTQEQLDNAALQTKLSMANRDLYSVRTASRTLQEIVSSIFGFLFAVFILWRFAWGIALLLILLIPLMAVVNILQTKRRRKSWQESTMYWRISGGLFNYITDPLRLFQIRIMGARDNVLKLYAKNVKKSNEIELKAERKNIRLALIDDILSPILEMGTRVWAIVLVAGAKLTFDQFLFVIGLIQQASSQTFTLGYTISNAQETYMAATALKEVMDYEMPTDGKETLPTAENGGIAIDLQNVSLTYINGTHALKNVSLQIPAGKKVAIVGENGAGKSSLLRIMTRQYEPSSGQILLNGIHSSEISRESLYEHIVMLDQDYYLFEDLTIKQNMTIVNNNKLTDGEINKALEVVSLKDKISTLKHGMNTRLDKSYDDGSDLSGGQRQRLAIARILTKKYQLMILDEPTSAIDAKAERDIFNSLFKNNGGATMVIVSHRFSTVRKADYIYVVDAGVVIEQGSHEQLMALNGHYAELYCLQADDFK